jgi:Flp pilus assembly pilin Flp
MSNALYEQYLRASVALTQFVYDARDRMREQRGQTTVEWLVIMVGLIALAGALAASGIWTQVATKIGQAFSDLIGKVAGKST